ncbi:MAG: helix-turn-helix transcriptional regulator [Arcanobacterium sp.]|nr:helix-turn-helix transcriptional regulator [Arcanobacterium sp.]
MVILADKLIDLRKKNGWSQEALAAKLGVSRQAISKWESTQSMPDLDRIVAMSEVFGVSTDYLIKDGIAAERAHEEIGDVAPNTLLRQVSMEEAVEFLAMKRRAAIHIAAGVAVCIVAFALPTVLNILAADPARQWPRDVVEALSGILFFVPVAAAVALFIVSGMALQKFSYLSEEAFETAYGVSGMVKQQRSELQPRMVLHVTVGVVLCIFAVLTFIAEDLFGYYYGPNGRTVIALGFVLVAIAVYLFIRVAIPWGALNRLEQSGDYTIKQKQINKKIGPVMGIYWLGVTAIYLAYSFATDLWDRSWAIWPVAGVLCGILAIGLAVALEHRANRA